MSLKKRVLVLISLSAFFCGSSILFSQEIVVTKKDGSPIKGVFVKAENNGDLWLKQGPVQTRIKTNEYSYARLTQKPKDIDAAQKILASKNYDAAAAEFKKLYASYRFVGYDVACILGESTALAASGKKPEAITRLKLLDKYELADQSKESDFYEARKLLASLYIDESKFDEAMEILSELGQSNDDNIATFGFNSRGNILLKQNKKKDAILMFMRTALLFPVENKERPRALMLVANTLKEMQDNRGGIFADMLKSEYPGNALIGELK